VDHIEDVSKIKLADNSLNIINHYHYFKAEFFFRYVYTDLDLCIGNIFKLDITQIKIELQKIEGEKRKLEPEDIAKVLTCFYPEAHIFLACFNGKGKDDYPEIAKLINEKRGVMSSKKFGF
jgi:hypothetical protein